MFHGSSNISAKNSKYIGDMQYKNLVLEKNEPRSAVLLWAFFTVQSVHLRAPIEYSQHLQGW